MNRIEIDGPRNGAWRIAVDGVDIAGVITRFTLDAAPHERARLRIEVLSDNLMSSISIDEAIVQKVQGIDEEWA